MLSFQKASIDDIYLLRTLAREIWTTCYPGIITMEQIEYMLNWMYSAETIRKEIKEGVYWELVYLENMPIGFLSITCTNDGIAKLNKLYMKNTHHGKGFGQQALSHVTNFARKNKLKEVYLTVNKENSKAIKAYEKAGFVRSDSVVNDIGGGFVMDDYIYRYIIK
ncbi:MAG TPA: GNAT family N-acetyltransferase [Bacteroidales bacterium]